MRTQPAGWEEIYAVVRRIPRGKVATYGQVAALLGRPRAARQVGYAMAALRGARHDVPWQRVLGARPRGRAAVSILDPMGAAVQQEKLRREGIRFDGRGMVALERFGWSGGARPPAPPTRPSPASPARSRRRTAGSSGRRRTSRSGPR